MIRGSAPRPCTEIRDWPGEKTHLWLVVFLVGKKRSWLLIEESRTWYDQIKGLDL